MHQRLPLVPEHILKAHKVHEPTDGRFKAVARLLQSLWREEKGLPIGTHRPRNGKRRKLGSRIDMASAKHGNNFLSPDIAKLAYRESVYREIGAMIEQERLWTNLLSSQPLCFNLFGPLKLDMGKANQFFRHLFPDYVASVNGIYFEHSPGRGDPSFTNDHTAFDVFVTCTTVDGDKGFIAIEVKYSESMNDPPANMRPRYDDLSKNLGLYSNPDSQHLRWTQLQQFWREHMLSSTMVKNGLYASGRFVVIYPDMNYLCALAVKNYKEELASNDPKVSGFHAIPLEMCISTMKAIGDEKTAEALYARYLDFQKVEQVIFA